MPYKLHVDDCVSRLNTNQLWKKPGYADSSAAASQWLVREGKAGRPLACVSPTRHFQDGV